MLKLIFWVVVGVLILSFFGVSLQSLVHSPTTQANFGFVWELIVSGWHQILALLQHALYVLQSVFTTH